MGSDRIEIRIGSECHHGRGRPPGGTRCCWDGPGRPASGGGGADSEEIKLVSRKKKFWEWKMRNDIQKYMYSWVMVEKKTSINKRQKEDEWN